LELGIRRISRLSSVTAYEAAAALLAAAETA